MYFFLHFIKMILLIYITADMDVLNVMYVKLCVNYCTVPPAKSDSDILFCLQSYWELESIDHLCINSIHRIG